MSGVMISRAVIMRMRSEGSRSIDGKTTGCEDPIVLEIVSAFVLKHDIEVTAGQEKRDVMRAVRQGLQHEGPCNLTPNQRQQEQGHDKGLEAAHCHTLTDCTGGFQPRAPLAVTRAAWSAADRTQ
jgi:hypothetical protein